MLFVNLRMSIKICGTPLTHENVRVNARKKNTGVTAGCYTIYAMVAFGM